MPQFFLNIFSGLYLNSNDRNVPLARIAVADINDCYLEAAIKIRTVNACKAHCLRLHPIKNIVAIYFLSLPHWLLEQPLKSKTYIIDFGGDSRPRSLVVKAFTSRQKDVSNLSLSFSHPVKSAAIRILTSSALPFSH
jgi:hypothetical protein